MTIAILSLVILLSCVAVIFLIKYTRYLLRKIIFFSQNLNDLMFVVSHFSEHLNAVHEMQTYYGDQIIQGLIEHSKEVEQYLKNYKEIYSVTNEFEEGEYNIAEEESQENI